MVGNHDARRQRRGARAQSFAERNVVVDFELDGRQFQPRIGGHGQRGLARSGCPRPSKSAPHRGPTPGCEAGRSAGTGNPDKFPAPGPAHRSRDRDWRSRPERGRESRTRSPAPPSPPCGRTDKPRPQSPAPGSPLRPPTSGLRPVRMASPKSRNWRSNGSSEIAIGSDAPDATSFATGAGSPESFSTSHVVSLSPEMIAVPFVPWNSVRSV